MTFGEHVHASSCGDDHAIGASGFACNAVCPDCTFLSYCPMEPNHYGAHRCQQGHSF